VTTILVVGFKMRALTALDHLNLGIWPSVLVTVLWITAITNAFNFLDNMDGLSAGVAAVATTAFLITTLLIGQWFVAANSSFGRPDLPRAGGAPSRAGGSAIDSFPLPNSNRAVA